jgi:hypothetical protein
MRKTIRLLNKFIGWLLEIQLKLIERVGYKECPADGGMYIQDGYARDATEQAKELTWVVNWMNYSMESSRKDGNKIIATEDTVREYVTGLYFWKGLSIYMPKISAKHLKPMGKMWDNFCQLKKCQ